MTNRQSRVALETGKGMPSISISMEDSGTAFACLLEQVVGNLVRRVHCTQIGRIESIPNTGNPLGGSTERYKTDKYPTEEVMQNEPL